MTTSESKVIHTTDDKFEHVYLINVPVVYAVVHKPRLKYQSNTEYEYSLTAFVTDEMREQLEDNILVNKQFHKVGVDKNKKRNIKYPTSAQREDGNDTYDAFEGLNGVSLTCPAKTRKGKKRFIVIKDANGDDVVKDLGNGTLCSIKLFGYRNADEFLNVTVSAIKVIDLVEYIRPEPVDDILGIDTTQTSQSGTQEEREIDETEKIITDEIPF